MKRANIKYLLISLILILSLSLGSGCLVPPIAPPSPAPTPSPPPSGTTTPIDSGWKIPLTENQPSLPSIADVVAKVKPSVVAINTEVVTYIFNQPRTQQGAGSGWIIRGDGVIITNNHVVEGAKSITVTLDDGRTFPVDMQTVATDPVEDLAVLKIGVGNLPAVTVGDSLKLRVGDWVVAIGNSLGLGITAKEGIVSRLKVSMTVSAQETLYNLLETSAAINPGNSGGPLVNMAGEVIGITSAKISAAGVEGMGYAIPSQEAVPIIQQLINTGYVVRPWLGVGLYTVDQYVVFRYNLGVDKGVFVTNVAAGSPADKAGIKAGDVIVSMNGKEVAAAQELMQTIHSSKIGQQVEIIFWRGKTKYTVSATLIKSPPPS